MHVAVLNGTETTGLAHKLAEDLRQSGYAQAAASSAQPSSGRATSVVEYASGHRAEAEHVGQTLGIGALEPLEGVVGQAVGGTSVVVIAGADKASLVSRASEAPPGEGAPGGGEG
jgi:hypothetical protein